MALQRFREWRRLPKPRAPRCFEFALQAIDSPLQPIILALELFLLMAQPLLLPFRALRTLAPADLITSIRWFRIFPHDLLMPESSRQYKRYALNNHVLVG
jgi:hypothetical protein